MVSLSRVDEFEGDDRWVGHGSEGVVGRGRGRRGQRRLFYR